MCGVYSQLVATLHQAQMTAVRVAAPINIERFDNLSTWDIFQVPKVEEVMGIDHVARMTVALPVTCVGPLDPINVLVNISPNPDYPKARKIRVSRIQVSIEEVLSFKPTHGCEPIIKRKRILRNELECAGVKLDVFTPFLTKTANFKEYWNRKRNPHSIPLQGSPKYQSRNRRFFST